MSVSHQIHFVRKFEEEDGVTIFFVPEKQQKTVLTFSLGSLIVTEYYKNGISKNIKFIE